MGTLSCFKGYVKVGNIVNMLSKERCCNYHSFCEKVKLVFKHKEKKNFCNWLVLKGYFVRSLSRFNEYMKIGNIVKIVIVHILIMWFS